MDKRNKPLVQRRVARAVLLVLMAQLPLDAAQAQVVADPGARIGKKPMVQTAPNGVPVVNISLANSAGVSHNLFSSFNVAAGGVVLNNSKVGAAGPTPAPAPAPPPATPSPPPPAPKPCARACRAIEGVVAPTTGQAVGEQSAAVAASASGQPAGTDSLAGSLLVGSIGANPLLETGPARLIVAEVTGAGRSNLFGTVEIFGNAADLVIANPWGLSCNGCGFVNAGRASLVSGLPTWAGATLDGFAVTGAQVSVGSAGLNGGGLSSLDLVGGSLQVTGPVRLAASNSAIYAVAGPNQVNYATLAPSALTRSDTRPALAIDVASTGGMYANQIYLMATEQGLGVNHAGKLQAGSGGLTLDANGALTLSGSLKSSAAAVVSAPQINATALNLSAASLALLQSSGKLTLSASQLAGSEVMLWANGALWASDLNAKAGGDIRLTSGADLDLKGGRIEAVGNVTLDAKGDLTLSPTSYSANTVDGGIHRTTTRYSRVEISAGTGLAAASANGLLTLDGAQLNAGTGSIALHGQSVALVARKDLTSELTVAGSITTKPTTETLVGVKLQAEGDIAVLATGSASSPGQGKLFATGANIESTNGHVSLLAAGDVDISHDITTDRYYLRFYEVKRSWFSKRVTDNIKTSVDETVQPSVISGRSVSVGAGGALNLVGSMVLADGAVGLHADKDLNLLSTNEADFSYSASTVKKSGIFGNGGLSITIGSKTTTEVTSQDWRTQHGSSVASLAGDIVATAGGQYLQMSSDLVAPQGDISVAAANVAIKSNSDTTSLLNLVRQRQSGLTLSASHPIVETAQTVAQMAKLAKRTDNGRYQALALLTAGLTVYNNFRSFGEQLKDAANPLSNGAMGGWNISASLGSSSYSFDSLTQTSTPVSSSIDAGRHLLINATGNPATAASGADSGDITLVAAKLSAGGHMSLAAQRDITLAAAIGSSSEATQTRSSSGAIGLGYNATNGLSFTLAASRSNGYSNGWGTTYWQSQAAAGQTLNLESGRHTALSGAKASGQAVVVRVGSNRAGDLAITSPQDQEHYLAKEKSWGINLSVPVPGGTAPPSLGLSASQLNLMAEYEAVRQQSAISAGTGGFDINVNGHTHLRGGAITTEGAAANSRLTTQTLSHESLQNKDVEQGNSWSVSLSIATKPGDAQANADKANNRGPLAGSSIGYARIDTNNRSSTHSGVGGAISLTRPDLQAARVTTLRAAERAPLEGRLGDAQRRLNDLLGREPPPCDGCYYTSLPGTVDGSGAGALASTHSVKASAAPSGMSVGTDAAIGSVDYSYQWRAWNDAVQSAQAEVARLSTRIVEINNKPYGDVNSLASNALSLVHQPLLPTFDRSKATQALKDGVAVTAAFGKAAYKTAGDEADRRQRAANDACSNKANCPEADRWKEGGAYRTALHMAIGAVGQGSQGAIGNLAGTLAVNAMDTALQQIGITDVAAQHVLKNIAATVAGAAAGSAQGAAAAFNADTNNRQLHPNEKARIRQLAGGDSLLEQRLSAAACHMVRCSAEFPAGTEAHDALMRLERVGATLEAEINLLKRQTDTHGQLFAYGYFDGWRDNAVRVVNKDAMLYRLGGGLQTLGGGAGVIAGGIAISTGISACSATAGAACLIAKGGALLSVWGVDQIAAGTKAVVSGKPEFTLGAHLIAEVTGISLGSAELWYSVPGFLAGGGAATTAAAESRALALEWRLAAASYGHFTPKGLIVTDAIKGSPAFQSMVTETTRAGVSIDDAIKYAIKNFESGVSTPTLRVVDAQELLFKIVPKGTGVNETSAFWMTADQAKAVSKMSNAQAAGFLGLPEWSTVSAQLAGGFDMFAIAPKIGVKPVVFESTVAPTIERVFIQGGGARQAIVPNRSLWTEAIKVNPNSPTTFKPYGGG